MGRISRVLVAALLAASCTVTPSVTPPTFLASPSPEVPPAPTAPTATGVPIPTAILTPTGAPIGVSWERAVGLDGAEVFDVAPGPSGWVAVGSTCADDCATSDPAAWVSVDGLSWSAALVPEGPRGVMTSVASDGRTWFAAGVTFEEPQSQAGLIRGHIWRSPDGITWSLVRSITLGPCFEGCPTTGHLAAGPGGAVLTLTKPGSNPRGMYSTVDGESWKPVDMSIFDAQFTFWPEIAPVVVNGRFVVTANACATCRAVWSSSAGRSWTLDATLEPVAKPDPPPGALQLATDGRRAIAVGEGCFLGCESDVFLSADGRTGWTPGSETLPIWAPRATYAAGMFVAAGKKAPNGLGVFASPDGAEWTPIASNLALGDCEFMALAGSEDRMVVVLVAENAACSGIWVSRAPSP